MMKTIKIIDLLNKIANGEKVPEKIFYAEQYWINGYPNDYEGLKYGGCLLNNVCLNNLNDEVRILEEKEMCHKCHKYPAEYNQTYCEFCLGISELEEKKIPEKLKDILRVDDLIPPVDENMYKIWTQTIKNQNKINEILDYLESKGE